jgi:PhnB protein
MNEMLTVEKETKEKVEPVPPGYHTVTSFVVVKGAAKLLDFTAKAFGAVEISRMSKHDGTISHAETRIGDSVIMMFDSKRNWPTTPAFIRLYVENCDAIYKQAIQSGARSVTEPTSMPWGDRVARVRDPLGNVWWIMTRMENVSPEEIEKRSTEKKYIDAMKYVESAEFFAF